MTSPDLIAAALERHRDDPTPRLQFNVPLDRLIDPTHCGALAADIAKLAKEGWEVRNAVPTAWRMIPAMTGLYMFVWRPQFRVTLAADGNAEFLWILYVGRAGGVGSKHTLRARYKTEYSKFVGGDPDLLWDPELHSSRPSLMRRFLSLRPLEYWFCVIEDEDEINSLERRLYNLFTPPLNQSGGPRLRAGKAVAAFG